MWVQSFRNLAQRDIVCIFRALRLRRHIYARYDLGDWLDGHMDWFNINFRWAILDIGIKVNDILSANSYSFENIIPVGLESLESHRIPMSFHRHK